MAKKRKHGNSKKQDQQAMILAFAHRLRLPSIEAYQQWCAQQGFSTSLNKTERELDAEYRKYITQVAQEALKRHKRESKLQHYIQQLYSKEVLYAGSHSEALHVISDGFNKIQNRRLLRDVLCQLDKHSKLLGHPEYIRGVIGFVSCFNRWIRPIKQWKPSTRNADRQFASLARHLFAKYPVPAFMDSVWQQGNSTERGWFIHIGMGNNIRTANQLPLILTKKMAHHFLKAPASYSVKAAFRWAQVHALGGNKAIADAIVQTRLARNFKDEEFWSSVLRFFIDNPMLDRCQYGPIIDYIWQQKYEPQYVFVDRGVARREPPLQPNFTMKGRTPETLLRNVEEWHRQLGKETRGRLLQWPKSRIGDFQFVEGTEENANMKIWAIRELISNKELIAEGRALQHCVATYASSCVSGRTSIWTMDMQNNVDRKKLVTIELNLRNKTICQVRGLRNRMPNRQEISIIRRWADKENIKVAGYAIE